MPSHRETFTLNEQGGETRWRAQSPCDFWDADWGQPIPELFFLPPFFTFFFFSF